MLAFAGASDGDAVVAREVPGARADPVCSSDGLVLPLVLIDDGTSFGKMLNGISIIMATKKTCLQD